MMRTFIVIGLLLALVSFAQGATPGTASGRVAFARDGDIWTISSAGGEPRRLTNDGKNRFPLWSPDGRRLAFVKLAYSGPENKGYHLWVMNAEGEDARKLFGDAETFAFPWQYYEYWQSNWSPDGTWIALASTNLASLRVAHHDSPCLSDLWVVRSDGSAAKRLVPDKGVQYRGYTTCYSWSPGSDRLLYWNAERHWGSFTSIALSGQETLLKRPRISNSASLGLHDPAVAWQRDGKHLLIGRNSIWGTSGLYVTQLYRVALTGRAVRLPLGRPDWISSFSHRRDRVAYDALQTAGGKERRILFVSRVDGTHRVRLAARPEEGADTVTRWSPDDTRLAYFPKFGNRIAIADPTGRARAVRTFRAPAGWRIVRAQWAPDGRHLAVLAAPPPKPGAPAPDDGGDIYVADVVGGAWTQLTQGAACRDMEVQQGP